MKITTIQQPKPFIPKVPDFKHGDIMQISSVSGSEYTFLVTKISGLYYLIEMDGSGKWTDGKESIKGLQNYLENSPNIVSVKVYSTEKVELILKEEY